MNPMIAILPHGKFTISSTMDEDAKMVMFAMSILR